MTALSGTAIFSGDRRYRYQLWRKLTRSPVGTEGTVAFCMLNPSTADATFSDRTVARCEGFASAWGYHKLAVVNLYPLVATDPADLWAWVRADSEVVRAQWAVNLRHIKGVVASAALVVAAWGAPPVAQAAGHELVATLARQGTAVQWWCFGRTRTGAPRHPLYLRNDTELVRL